MKRTNLALIERDRLIAIEKHTRARAEEVAVATGRAETIALCRARGDEISTPRQGRGEAPKPAQRVLKADGLDLMKPKLSDKQFSAGRRFEAFYRATHRSDTKSCLNVMEGGTGVRYDHSAALAYARYKLTKAAKHIGHHAGMWQALEKVCGEGKRPSEINPNRRAYERIETNLDCALSILVKHWGL